MTQDVKQTIERLRDSLEQIEHEASESSPSDEMNIIYHLAKDALKGKQDDLV